MNACPRMPLALRTVLAFVADRAIVERQRPDRERTDIQPTNDGLTRLAARFDTPAIGVPTRRRRTEGAPSC